MTNFEVLIEAYRLLDSVTRPLPAEMSKDYSRALSSLKSVVLKCVCISYSDKKSKLRK